MKRKSSELDFPILAVILSYPLLHCHMKEDSRQYGSVLPSIFMPFHSYHWAETNKTDTSLDLHAFSLMKGRWCKEKKPNILYRFALCHYAKLRQTNQTSLPISLRPRSVSLEEWGERVKLGLKYPRLSYGRSLYRWNYFATSTNVETKHLHIREEVRASEGGERPRYTLSMDTLPRNREVGV